MNLTEVASYIYTVLLKPQPLRFIANALLLLIIPKSVKISEGTLLLHPKDPVISGALALGVYEPYQMKVFRSIVKGGDVVLDIGANIGLYTLIASKHIGVGGSVLSFEPELENFNILSKNIEINTLTNARAVRVAVSDTNGTSMLSISKDNKGNHSLVAEIGSNVKQEVSVVRLDDWLHAEEVRKIDVIKVDIQGAEPQAFIGMKETLRKARALFVEYEPSILRSIGHEPEQMLKLLQSCGYELSEIHEGKRKIVPLGDLGQFTQQLTGNIYANILATKPP
jgi:FkbM family methyltransferase